MNKGIEHTLFGIITVVVASVFFATSSLADTPKTTTEENNGQATYPYSMPGGMMGPGHRGYGGMEPGNRPYGGMGRSYMRQGGRGYGGMGPGMGYGGIGMMQALNLDKSQRRKFMSMMRTQRAGNCKAMTEMLDLRDQLAVEYDKTKPDAKVIGKLYEKMAEMQKHMIEQHIQMRNQMRGMLNKDQKENFDRIFHNGMGFGSMGMMNMMGGGMMGYGGWNAEE